MDNFIENSWPFTKMEDEDEELPRVEPERAFPRLRLTHVSVLIDDALSGDQLRLSPRILERIIHQEPISVSRSDSIGRDSGKQPEKTIDGPMVFALKLQDKCVYGAPKEFTAKEERQVGVSASLMKALRVPAKVPMPEKEFSVTLELVDLPSGSFVRLAPLTPNYLLIPDIR